uniref:Uncharacterized protein n=1 Tax=Anopheles maculatus TaxID=74869 RepID=A0A182SEG6_9DIPT
MLHYLYQASPSGPSGLQYGKRCTILPRSIHCNHSCPDRCGCIYAKLDYELQIGTEQQELITLETPSRNAADVQLPIDNHLTTKYVHCKVHVYQGRIFAGFLNNQEFDAKLTVLFENYEQALSRLPVNPNYWPLMILKHVDCTDAKRMKTIGNAIVNASDLVEDCSTTPESSTESSTIIEITQEENVTQFPLNIANQNPLNIVNHLSYARDVIKKQVESLNVASKSSKSVSSENLELTWWTKFYNSQLSQNCQKYSLKIYDRELESVAEFNGFKDWSGSYSLQKVKRSKKLAFKKQAYGTAKCQIQISSLVKTPKQQTIP